MLNFTWKAMNYKLWKKSLEYKQGKNKKPSQIKKRNL